MFVYPALAGLVSNYVHLSEYLRGVSEASYSQALKPSHSLSETLRASQRAPYSGELGEKATAAEQRMPGSVKVARIDVTSIRQEGKQKNA